MNPGSGMRGRARLIGYIPPSSRQRAGNRVQEHPVKTAMMMMSVAAAVLLAGCAGGPSVRWANTDRSDEHRAEAACRAEAGSGPGSAGANAAYEACMAEFRRPERDD